jgi:phage terminase large subunit-like protein
MLCRLAEKMTDLAYLFFEVKMRNKKKVKAAWKSAFTEGEISELKIVIIINTSSARRYCIELMPVTKSIPLLECLDSRQNLF